VEVPSSAATLTGGAPARATISSPGEVLVQPGHGAAVLRADGAHVDEHAVHELDPSVLVEDPGVGHVAAGQRAQLDEALVRADEPGGPRRPGRSQLDPAGRHVSDSGGSPVVVVRAAGEAPAEPAGPGHESARNRNDTAADPRRSGA